MLIKAQLRKKDPSLSASGGLPDPRSSSSSKLMGSLLEKESGVALCSLRESMEGLTAYFDRFVNRAERRVKS